MSKNQEICHKFIYAKEGESYDYASYKMSFNGKKLYSYNSVLAYIDREAKTLVVEDRIANYSNTSIKHFNCLMSATPGYYNVFKTDTSNPLGFYIDKINELLTLQARARKRDYTREIRSYIKEEYLYTTYFKQDKRSADYKAIINFYNNIDDLAAQTQEALDYQAEEAKRQKAEKAKRDKKNQEARNENLTNFLLDDESGAIKPKKYDPNYNSVYLKKVGDLLYTTNSIKVNFNSALALWKRYMSGKDIIGLKLEQYTVVKSSQDSVTIGCTTISNKEMSRIFKNYKETKDEISNA